MTLRPCIVCGTPTDATRCPDCAPPPEVKPATTAGRGYGARWQRTSRRARRLQPWCLDCGTSDDLTADHSPEAWARHQAGQAIRLQDIAVVCRSCNGKRGAIRDLGGRGTPRPRVTGGIGIVSVTHRGGDR